MLPQSVLKDILSMRLAPPVTPIPGRALAKKRSRLDEGCNAVLSTSKVRHRLARFNADFLLDRNNADANGMEVDVIIELSDGR